jgi:uncharacterized protein
VTPVFRVGLVSDTHGLFRPELLPALSGVDHILHAGDIGDPDILTALEAIAPVTAVWGNTDGWEIREKVAEEALVDLAGTRVRVVHGHRQGSPTAAAMARDHADVDVVVFGHSHKPEFQTIGETLAVNPGSAGPRRFSLPVTVGVLDIEGGVATARIVQLLDP